MTVLQTSVIYYFRLKKRQLDSALAPTDASFIWLPYLKASSGDAMRHFATPLKTHVAALMYVMAA